MCTFVKMNAPELIDESKYLDPVFLEYGMEVYSRDYIESLRAENLELKKKGKRSYNLIPQSGFQEKVLTSEADLVICGGVRGAGKTAVGLIGSFFYAENPDVNLYGFRRYENDVKRGIWKSCKPLFRGFANFADTTFEAKFFNGTGATMKMEHLASKVALAMSSIVVTSAVAASISPSLVTVFSFAVAIRSIASLLNPKR